jgi:uncharacterized peroxidase-related enzyme
MSRLPLEYNPTEKTTQMLAGIQQAIGMTPNIHKLMGHSQHVLEGYLAFSGALAKGSLSAQDREQIALAVAGFDRCIYCASAHSLLGKKAGLSEQETKNNLKGFSETPRTASLIKFCLFVLENKGNVSDQEMMAIRTAGFSDEQIVEIVGNIAINLFTNYFNHVAGTEVDFPKVSLD